MAEDTMYMIALIKAVAKKNRRRSEITTPSIGAYANWNEKLRYVAYIRDAINFIPAATKPTITPNFAQSLTHKLRRNILVSG